MSVLVTSKFDDDSIKNGRASMETAFSHYKSMGNFLDAQGQLTSTRKYKKDRIKNKREKVEAWFSPIRSQWGLSVAMETRVLIQSAPKPYAAFPPPQCCCT